MKALIIICLMVSGCSQYGGYKPTVDTYNDKYTSYLERDYAECRQLAEQASGGGITQSAIGAGVGGLVGAAGGAVVGAFTGNPAAGAAIGAAAGGFGGGAKQGYESDLKYSRAYNNCMVNRGHYVLR